MDSEYTAIDLCQFTPLVLRKEGLSLTKHKVPPSALLPLYHSEPGLYGDQALAHRRSAGYSWPPEARLLFNSNGATNCGRVPLVGAFAKLCQLSLENKKHDTRFGWSSPSAKICVAEAADLIVGSAIAFAPDKGSERILIIPDGLEEIALEALKQAIGRQRLPIKLLPRSIALALQWIHQNETLLPIDASEGFIGHLRLCYGGWDEWSVQLIPIKLVKYRQHLIATPIYDPCHGINSSGIWGVHLFLQFAMGCGITDALALWREVICGPFAWNSLHKLRPDLPLFTDILANMAVEEQLQLLLKQFPHLESLPISTSNHKIKEGKVTEVWQHQHRGLPDGASKLLGTIVDGCCMQLPFDDTKTIGQSILSSDRSHQDNNITRCDSPLSTAALEGAINFSKRLADGQPSFLYRLIPIDIQCRRDEKEHWESLVAQDQTVDVTAAVEERQIRGFAIPKGQKTITFVLRRLSVRSDRSKPLIKAVPTDPLGMLAEEDVPVLLAIHVKPGDGFAEVKILDMTGALLSKVNWSKMEDYNPYVGYLKERQQVVMKADLWQGVESAFEALKKSSGNAQRLKALEILDRSLKKQQLDKQDPHLVYRATASAGTMEERPLAFMELQGILDSLYRNPKVMQDSKLQTKIISCMGYLYDCVPSEFKEEQIKLLQEKEKLNSNQASCMGKIIVEVHEVQIFYHAFLKRIRTACCKTYWVQLFTVLASMRERVLHPETIDDQAIDEIARFILQGLQAEIDIRKCRRKAMTFVRAIQQLLRRREYQPLFFEPESECCFNFVKNLKILKEHSSSRNLLVIDATIKLLCYEASKDDALLLYQDLQDNYQEEME